MKKMFSGLVLLLCFLFFEKSAFAQSRKSYSASRFSLILDGSGNGLLKPVQKGDTLVYTINRLADSVLVRKKFDTLWGATGNKYFLLYQEKKKPKGRKTFRKPK